MAKKVTAPTIIPLNAVFTLDSAAATLGVGRTTIELAARNGTLHATRPGHSYLMTGEALLDWVKDPASQKKPLAPLTPEPGTFSKAAATDPC